MSVETFKAVEEESRMEQKPSRGRVVHYVPRPEVDDNEKEPMAAMIAHVDPSRAEVNLTVFLPSGETTPRVGVPFVSGGVPGTCFWPPRT